MNPTEQKASHDKEGSGASVPMRNVINIDEGVVREHLDAVVTRTVEQTLNALLDAEADRLCGAARYEHSADRVDTRAGSYKRQLHTKAGEVTLKVPKLRSLPFETTIIERYRRLRFACVVGPERIRSRESITEKSPAT